MLLTDNDENSFVNTTYDDYIVVVTKWWNHIEVVGNPNISPCFQSMVEPFDLCGDSQKCWRYLVSQADNDLF